MCLAKDCLYHNHCIHIRFHTLIGQGIKVDSFLLNKERFFRLYRLRVDRSHIQGNYSLDNFRRHHNFLRDTTDILGE